MINETIFDLFENVQVGFLVDSAKAVAGDIRLDSSHFVDDSNIVLNENIKFTTLRTFIDDVEEPKLFTRIYCDKEFGVPYISSSEMSEIEPPVNSRFISKTLTSNINQYIIKRGQVLVSAAGTVGSIVLATKELDGVAGTSDILRINVDKQTNLGFVFTYLTSSFGANELANLSYGAIIKRVRGFQLDQLKTPLIANKSILQMNKLVLAALDKRDEANMITKEAMYLIFKFNNLPYFTESELNHISYKVTNLIEFNEDYRLDAHFYNPLAELAVCNIKSHSPSFKNLFDVADCSFKGSRSIRNYVDKAHGVPFLSGKNIIQIRPDFKHISKTETSNLGDMIVEKNQILISRSGTLGRTVFVWNNYENCAASEHLIRVVPNADLVDEGYLYAFLSSDYGYHQLLRYKHGSVIDEITEDQISQSVIPLPTDKQQKQIGDLVRQAYDLRAEAIRLEDEAQTLLTQALTKE